MTDDQKHYLIARMLDDAPELTDAELQAIESDAELRAICTMSAAIDSVCRRQPEVDPDAEWKRFRVRLRHHRRGWRLRVFAGGLTRVAAVIAAVVICAAIAVSYFNDQQQPPVVLSHHAATVGRRVPRPCATVMTAAVQIVAPTMLATVNVTPAHTAAETPAPAAADVTDATVDIDTYMRREQARIDNELALQIASVIESEYQAMADFQLPSDASQNVTMQ